MNYLAHALLSFDQPDLLTGNMMGDFIKGKNYLKFPVSIQRGILLHRFIDRATDEHPLVFEATALFKPAFLLSAGVFTDIFFDHFLANDPRYFNEPELLKFTEKTYSTLKAHSHLFDEKMSTFFGYMARHNWLYHYREMEGIERSVTGICKRHPRLGDAALALKLFETHYESLRLLYTDFFPLLKDHCEEFLKAGTDQHQL